MNVEKMDKQNIDEYVDLFIDVFTKEPWNDVYDSRDQVVTYFKNYFQDSYFLGYVLKLDSKVVGLCIGAKKPWIKGMEYYIDHFCIAFDSQGKGFGSYFIKAMEEEIKKENLNAVILNTERGKPSEKFYLKNGFSELDELMYLAK